MSDKAQWVSRAWWPNAPGDGGYAWCDSAHVKYAGSTSDQWIDLSCHTDDGKHSWGIVNADGSVSVKSWWPSDPGQGPGWCDPSHTEFGGTYGSSSVRDLICRADDGAIARAVADANGNYTGAGSQLLAWPN